MRIKTGGVLSVLLALVLLLGIAPPATFAAEGDVAIDATNFPDTNFRKFIQTGIIATGGKIDADGDGTLSREEIAAVTTINVDGSNKGEDEKIADLTGVEYFTELTTLDCSDNQLTSLDFNNNMLREFTCSNNRYQAASNPLDLATLPGNFDVSNASGWSGGSVEATRPILTFAKSEATYTYDCGARQRTTFTLLRPAPIPAVAATVVEPAGGAHPDMTAAVGPDADYSAEVIGWQKGETYIAPEAETAANPVWVNRTDVFTAGQKYWAVIKFTPNLNFEMTANTAVTINESRADEVTLPDLTAARGFVAKATVTFDMQGHGTPVSPQEIDYGGTVTQPDNPQETGYTFGGWFKDASCTNAWDFATDTVTENVTLYAQWSAVSAPAAPTLTNVTVGGIAPVIDGHTLTFTVDPNTEYTTGTATLSTDVLFKVESNNGNIKITGTAKTTDNLTEIALALLKAQTADAGNTGVMGSTLIDYSPVTITLTAQANPSLVTVYTVIVKATAYVATYTVTFDMQGHGTQIDPLTLNQGDTVTKPADPTEEGWIFGGWFKKAECLTAWDFDNDTVTADVTLFAQWSPAYQVTTPPTVDNGTVSVDKDTASKDSMVIVTVTPDKGYVIDKLFVTSKDGKKIALKDMGNGKYSFIMPAGQVDVQATFKQEEQKPEEEQKEENIPGAPDIGTVPPSAWKCDGSATCPCHHMTDINTTQWYHEALDYAVSHGYMMGTSPTTFAPNMTTTRAMIVTILYRLENEPAVSSAIKFSDVTDNQWYTAAIRWGAEKGIVAGYGYGKFGPEDPITREQMAAILYRYAQYKGYTLSAAADLNEFTDVSAISGYAVESLRWATAHSLVQGMDDGTLAPRGNATRAQVAAILMRFIENIAK